MIVPTYRLLFWVAAVLVPFATLWTAVPSTALWSALIVLSLLVVVLIDAVLACGSLDGIDVELPALMRMTKDRESAIAVRIRNEKQQGKRLRLGLPFPPEFHSPHEDQMALLPAEAQWSCLTWPCTPRQRGNFVFDRCYLESLSPIGFWHFRAVRPTRSEARVYPNLLTERKNLAAIFLNRGGIGIHAQRQVGKGRDFEKLREYIPGDSYEDIHWKATAKRGRPVTKVFQVERTQEVYVIIDASRLSAREVALPSDAKPAAAKSSAILKPDTQVLTGDPTTTTTLERFVTAALILGLAAERQGDLFGLASFSDKMQGFVRAKTGRSHFNSCRDSLYALQPQIVTPDFDEVCTFLRLRLRRRALLVFLTSLDDPILAESFLKNIGLISRQHLVLVNVLKPAGAEPVFSGSPAQSSDEMAERLGGHLRWQHLRELEKVLQRRGVNFCQLENEALCTSLVSQYLSIKHRQLL